MNAITKEGLPVVNLTHIQQMLNDAIEASREEGKEIDEPKAQALLETTAEVLGGLVTAFDHYASRKPAWV